MEDVFIKITPDQVTSGDIVIERKNGEIIHSMRIFKNFGILTAREKNGISPGPFNTTPVSILKYDTNYL